MSSTTASPPVLQIEVEAVFENGVFRPLTPLTIPEHTKVLVTVAKIGLTKPDEMVSTKLYGVMRWTGDQKSLERLAIDPEIEEQ